MWNLHLGFVLCYLYIILISCSSRNLPLLSFLEGYSQLFGDDNLRVLENGQSVQITLNERTGSGFVSQDLYLHGFYSASIKLPEDYTAGVVVAFYMSNGDIFEKEHDEVDFEFLGNIRGKEWRIQTNVYGNGSTSRGREERYSLWFDPSDDFHNYTILWTNSQIIFYVDNVPIREMKKTIGGDFPSKPMSVYATIWDGSKWATNGGKYKVNYNYAPYIARFSNFVLHGCSVDPTEKPFRCENDTKYDSVIPIDHITSEQRAKMMKFRMNHMQYSYCYDRTRYKVPLADCVIVPYESDHVKMFKDVKSGEGRPQNKHGHNKYRSRKVTISSI